MVYTGRAHCSFRPIFPIFLMIFSKMTTSKILGCQTPPKSKDPDLCLQKIYDFMPNSWTETLISPIFTTSTPPLAIHGWKAMDLTVNLAPSYRDLKDPTTRQNFDDTVEQKRVIDLRACHISNVNLVNPCTEATDVLMNMTCHFYEQFLQGDLLCTSFYKMTNQNNFVGNPC